MYFIGFEMKLKHFLRLIILFLCVLIYPNSAFSTVTAEQARLWANDKGLQIIEILTSRSADKYNQLDEIFDRDVDTDYAASFAAGKYWKQMSERQKDRYQPLFKRYLSALYKSYPLDLQAGSLDFEVEKIIINQADIKVFCRIYFKRFTDVQTAESTENINVIFSLVEHDDDFKVRDFKIAETGFLQTLRTRFYEKIHEADDDIDWFLEDFSALVQNKENHQQEKITKLQF